MIRLTATGCKSDTVRCGLIATFALFTTFVFAQERKAKPATQPLVVGEFLPVPATVDQPLSRATPGSPSDQVPVAATPTVRWMPGHMEEAALGHHWVPGYWTSQIRNVSPARQPVESHVTGQTKSELNRLELEREQKQLAIDQAWRRLFQEKSNSIQNRDRPQDEESLAASRMRKQVLESRVDQALNLGLSTEQQRLNDQRAQRQRNREEFFRAQERQRRQAEVQAKLERDRQMRDEAARALAVQDRRAQEQAARVRDRADREARDRAREQHRQARAMEQQRRRTELEREQRRQEQEARRADRN